MIYLSIDWFSFLVLALHEINVENIFLLPYEKIMHFQ